MNKKTYFTTCQRCGASLDPGERCECMDKIRRIEKTRPAIRTCRKTGHSCRVGNSKEFW